MKVIDSNGSIRTVIYTEVSSVDVKVNVNSTPQGTVSSSSNIDINVTDSLGAVTPDSVSIVGNTITIDVPDAPVGGSVGATLMKTGQTTSYRTGDDGDLEAGRATDFFTLASVNPFSTLDRFTDELGGQTYTNKIVIDWSTYNGSTVLGYYRTSLGSNTWDNAIDAALAHSVGSFTTGWRLVNVNELMNICQWNASITYVLNYSPFNISASPVLTSTTAPNNTAAMIYKAAANSFSTGNKTIQSGITMPVRTFTVTGTTLS